MQQNNLVKICPSCSYKNAVNDRRCANCDTRLAGVPIQSEIPQVSSVPDVPKSQPGSQQTREISFIEKIALKKRLCRSRIWFPSVALTFVFVTVIVIVFFIPKIKGPGSTPTQKAVSPPPTYIATPSSQALVVTHLPLPQGLGEVTDSHGHSIGVNDGFYAPFDSGRPDQALKQQAADKLKAGDTGGALARWHNALSMQSNDAEVLIYIEDQHVLSSGKPYITLIAGTAFTPPFPDSSYESIVQGIYVAQHEFNTANHPFQVRILIANSGSDVDVSNTTDVARQIVQVARQDPTVVGVIGWLHSENTLNALRILAEAHIPVISPQSTADELTGASPYFFRVVAPNKEEALIATRFAGGEPLHVKKAVIFLDPGESFSQNLAQDIEQQFRQEGITDLHEETFTTDADTKNQPQIFKTLLNDAAQYHPDVLIFTGRSNIDTKLFQDVLPNTGPLAQTPVLAGSGSYNAEKNSYGRWYTVAVAYHGENNTPIAQQFAQNYSNDFFDGNVSHQGYGYTIANDHATVAYDATALTLKAVLNVGKTNPTAQDLVNELPKITGTHAFQGVSGLISFGSDGNPMNKPLVILFVPRNGDIQLLSVCSIKGCQ